MKFENKEQLSGAAVALELNEASRVDLTDAISMADETLEGLLADPLFKKRSSKTDWESLRSGLVKAALDPGGQYEPTVITSVGGAESEPVLAAGFNAVPAFELVRYLSSCGFSPRLVISSAGQYAVECNGLDDKGVMGNWQATRAIYEEILVSRYPDIADTVTFEYLDPSLRDYPDEIESGIREAALEEESLLAKASSMGSKENDFIEYMASHIHAFRDFQTDPERLFVIKLGAQSEERFSAFQKAAIEKRLPQALELGFVPNAVVLDDFYYGQITLYYPRIGSRPPYYPEADGDPLAADVPVQTYDELLESMGGEVLVRYKNLAKALGKTSLSPDEYLETVRTER